MTPGNREDFLYDDIIDLEQARREHRRFRAILSRFSRVLDVRDLLADIVDEPEAREFLVTASMEVVPSEPLARELSEMPGGQIVGMLRGERWRRGPISRALNKVSWELPPLPNLFFTRDTAMVVNTR